MDCSILPCILRLCFDFDILFYNPWFSYLIIISNCTLYDELYCSRSYQSLNCTQILLQWLTAFVVARGMRYYYVVFDILSMQLSCNRCFAYITILHHPLLLKKKAKNYFILKSKRKQRRISDEFLHYTHSIKTKLESNRMPT